MDKAKRRSGLCPACGRSDVTLMCRLELAKYLKVSVRQLDMLRKIRGFPLPVRLGGSLRWKQGDVDRWIEEQNREVD